MSEQKGQAAIDSVLREDRVFPPPESFAAEAFVPSREHYNELYRRSVQDPVQFWGEMAARLRWSRPWQRVLDWEPPFARWFVGGKINVAYNCLDRHLNGPRRNKAAIIWEGEPGEQRVLTYQELHREVCRFANVLKALGVQKGDRVAIYMPMIPEVAIAMLACARIGATHSVVFGGFSRRGARATASTTPAPRWSSPPTAAGAAGSVVPLKDNVDEALADAPSVENVVVVRRTGASVPMNARPRPLVARADGRGLGRLPAPSRSTASTRSSSSTPAARPASRRASAHDRRLPAGTPPARPSGSST